MNGYDQHSLSVQARMANSPTRPAGWRPVAPRDTLPRFREAKLSTKKRKDLPDSAFALPDERKFPIPDADHARNALARVQQSGSPEQIRKVKRAVHRKFPKIDVS